MTFKPPIGTEEERNSGKIWPGTWVDATPYLTKYQYGFHTGADLNNNVPFDSDAHAPVYAIGEGKVTYAQLVSKKVWGNLIVIDHGIVDGKPLFSRYGHVEAMNIKAGQLVKTGDQIAKVGNGEGLFPYHLHFDISATEQLLKMPTYWPGNDSKGVKHHFVDPKKWLSNQHVVGSLPVPDNTTGTTTQPTDNKPPRTPAKPIWHVIANGLDIQNTPSASSTKVSTLARGTKIMVSESGVKNEGFIWAQIVEGNFKDNWIKRSKADQSETYISTNPPQN